MLSVSNGRLANTFVSAAAPYFQAYHAAKICNDYSGSFLNPHFGSHGAVLFFGGGHAATNDNSLIALVLDERGGRFRRLIDPSPLFGRDSSPATQRANSLTSSTALADPATGEYRVDGQPAAPHSYGSGDVIGPAQGGAAHGTFVRVITGAGGVAGDVNAEAAHAVDFAHASGFADGPTPGYRWRRLSEDRGASGMAAAGRLAPPQWSVFVPGQRRIYYETRATTARNPPRWFDLATGRYATGTGTPRSNNADTPDNGTMLAVPQRQMLLFLDRFQGRLRIEWLDTSVAQPGWRGGVVLSQAVPLPEAWNCACWCEHNQRLLLAGVEGEPRAVIEITIPTELGSPWPVARAPLPGNQQIPVNDFATYKKWTYHPALRSIVYLPMADADGLDDRVFVYRPRGT